MRVVFDVDGTLTLTSEINRDALAQAFLEVFGVPLPSQDWSGYPRVSASGLLLDAAQRALERPPTQDETRRVQAAFMEHLMTVLFTRKAPLEVPGAVDAVRRLQQAGHTVALASGDWRAGMEVKLERAGFEIDGLPIASADDAPERDAIIAEAVARAGGPDGYTVYVGDGPWDIGAAQALGFAVVGVDPDATGRLDALGIEVVPDFVDYFAFEAHLMQAFLRKQNPG